MPSTTADGLQVTVTIDGRPVSAPAGMPVLEVARGHGVELPGLCHHPGLPPAGACRLCLVQVEGRAGRDLVAACQLPAAEGLRIRTSTPALSETRSMMFALLLASTGGAPWVRAAARAAGVDPAMQGPWAAVTAGVEPDPCIQCGRCVRACAAVGRGLLQFMGRGDARRVAMAGRVESPGGAPTPAAGLTDCLGCLACAAVCPSGAAPWSLSGDRWHNQRWRASVPARRCPACDRPYTSHSLPDEVARRLGGDAAGGWPRMGGRFRAGLCPACRRRAAARMTASGAGAHGLLPST